MVKVSVTEKGLDAVRSLEQPVRECHHKQLGHMGADRLKEMTRMLGEIRPGEDIEVEATDIRERGAGISTGITKGTEAK